MTARVAASPGLGEALDERDRQNRQDLPRSLTLLAEVAALLFASGQTTEHVGRAVARLGEAMGLDASVSAAWGDLRVCVQGPGGPVCENVAVAPVAVEMARVAAVMRVVDRAGTGRFDLDRACAEIAAIRQSAPVSTLRFTLLAAAGAAALGVIFGEQKALNFALIAISAGLGAVLRRRIAAAGGNPLLQPLSASMLAGAFGALAMKHTAHHGTQLIALCPCAILMPGPALLNGVLDLARLRLPLGLARMLFAALVTLMICTGLIAGLSLAGFVLPPSAPARTAPLLYDVLAAGVAVAAYGTFFSMPWRMLPIPILIGMLAHGCRWLLLVDGHASAAQGAFVACLIVGTLATLIGDKLHLPFAALAFSCVVSLIPGVDLFRMAGGISGLTAGQLPGPLFVTLADGSSALLILLAMTFGLILPKLFIEHFRPFQPRAALRSHPL